MRHWKPEQECDRAHIDAYLTKPVDALTLLDTVARLTLTPAKTDVPELVHPPTPLMNRSPPDLSMQTLLQHLAVLGGEQEDFLRTVIYGFLSETDKLLEAMRIALTKQEYATFKELAHILKGSSGNVGAEVLFSICCKILALRDSEIRISRYRITGQRHWIATPPPAHRCCFI